MPGRLVQAYSWQALWDFYSIRGNPPEVPLKPRYNLAPSQEATVMRLSPSTGERELVALQWGFIPSWAKGDTLDKPQINARGDRVGTAPFFRASFKTRRCVIPATGFYEWTTEGKQKQPHFIHREDGMPMSFAGVWDSREGSGQEAMTTFAAITTEPNAFMAPLHHRMGVVLEPEAVTTWLDPESSPQILQALLASHPWVGVTHHLVRTRVNSPRNDGPECIEPV